MIINATVQSLPLTWEIPPIDDHKWKEIDGTLLMYEDASLEKPARGCIWPQNEVGKHLD